MPNNRTRQYGENDSTTTLKVHPLKDDGTKGVLTFGAMQMICALGRGGIQTKKVEGDGVTPSGEYLLKRVFYRADRGRKPLTKLPISAICPTDGWCDSPNHAMYNRPVRLPFAYSHEKMWREDNLYDIGVILSHNFEPVQRGAGSAVFFHLAKPGFLPTAGCVAIERHPMLHLLASITPETRMRIDVEAIDCPRRLRKAAHLTAI